EARKGLGHDVNAGEAPVAAPDVDAVRRLADLNAGALERTADRGHRGEIRAHQLDGTAGSGRRHHIGAGLDAVGNDRVARTLEALHATDADAVGAGTLDVGTHGGETA